MIEYKNILVAVDYTSEARKVLEHAKGIAQKYSANLTLLHVTQITPVVGEFETFSYVDLYTDQPEILERAQQDLKKLATDSGLKNVKLKVLSGIPKVEIANYAEEHGIDLIVIGSHGRHGINLLLGSTANAVLHRAKCEVLAVRV